MRVLIVDDHQMFAESLGRLLSSRDQSDVRYAGSVADAGPAAGEHDPEVAIVDWNLPDGDGSAAIKAIRRMASDTRVVVFTGATSTNVVHQALDAGADGFVTKDRAADELFEAIDSVMRGEVSLTPEALAEVLRARREPPGAATLTERELQIVTMLAAGSSNKEIADTLFLSVNTVRNHVQRISNKLGAHSRLEVVVTAVRAGLIELPTEPA